MNEEKRGQVFDEHLHDEIVADNKQKTRHRSPGGNKFKIEVTEGDDLYGQTGELRKLNRVIDRKSDPKWYYERITDGKTGAVIKEDSGPLPEHRGHGSAKKK
jgi:hypothetical protein